jgi:hypothetical protein
MVQRLTRVHGAHEVTAEGQRWKVASELVPETVDLLEELKPVLVHPQGRTPLVLKAHATFRLVDASGAVLPGQDPEDYLSFAPVPGQQLGHSTAVARIADQSTCKLFLCLPFIDPGKAMDDSIKFLSRHSPVSFEKENWKRWTLGKKSDRYEARKFTR